MWFDKWAELCPLRNQLTVRNIVRSGFSLSNKVRDVIKNGNWKWPAEWATRFPEVVSIPVPVLIDDRDDELRWRGNNGILLPFSVSLAWEFIRSHHDEVWLKVRLLSCMDGIPPRLADILAFIIPISKGRSFPSIIARLVLAASAYFLWRERNLRLFQKKKMTVDQLMSTGSRLLLDQWRVPSYCIVHDGSASDATLESVLKEVKLKIFEIEFMKKARLLVLNDVIPKIVSNATNDLIDYNLPKIVATAAKYEKSSASTDLCRTDAFHKRDHDDHQDDDANPEGEKSAKKEKHDEEFKVCKRIFVKAIYQSTNIKTTTTRRLGCIECDPFSIVDKPTMSLIYLNSNNEKRFMGLRDITKFCDATLEKALKEVKMKIFETEFLKKTSLLGSLDLKIMKAYEREIIKRLKHREQMRRWESFVNGRPILPTMKH
uniref:Reverse transcriptase domain, reverse transcriptase zinc-binding domain protein n=1 Tax=Tanacetum cinerariifolium TaxID=118510 RepID=A0A6L2LGC9_TANCI|nr:hypothetical protein [Tanacetum cinerariifolium]